MLFGKCGVCLLPYVTLRYVISERDGTVPSEDGCPDVPLHRPRVILSESVVFDTLVTDGLHQTSKGMVRFGLPILLDVRLRR